MAEYIVGDKAIADATSDHFNCNEPLRLIRFRNDLGLERIVRCKDCKHCDIGEVGYFYSYCMLLERTMMEDNGFCAWGKRREDA